MQYFMGLDLYGYGEQSGPMHEQQYVVFYKTTVSEHPTTNVNPDMVLPYDSQTGYYSRDCSLLISEVQGRLQTIVAPFTYFCSRHKEML